MRGENTHGMRQNAENNHLGGLGGLRENRGRNDGLKNPVGDPQSGWGGGGGGLRRSLGRAVPPRTSNPDPV